MDLRILERYVNIHRTWAESFKQKFSCILNRPLSECELVTIEDTTLCLSFMRLESIDLRLHYEDKASQAEATLLFMQQEVQAARAEIQQYLEMSAKKLGLTMPISAEGSLLFLEEKLLSLAKQTNASSVSSNT